MLYNSLSLHGFIHVMETTCKRLICTLKLNNKEKYLHQQYIMFIFGQFGVYIPMLVMYHYFDTCWIWFSQNKLQKVLVFI
jgi:hypothetical protein